MQASMEQGFFLSLMLPALLLVLYGKCEVYYVRPNYPTNMDCPGSPCQSLDDYIKQSDQESLYQIAMVQ